MLRISALENIRGMAFPCRQFHYSDVHLFVFARTGFTEECRKRAETLGRVHLITFDEICAFFDETVTLEEQESLTV